VSGISNDSGLDCAIKLITSLNAFSAAMVTTSEVGHFKVNLIENKQSAVTFDCNDENAAGSSDLCFFYAFSD
jgi:hypothetical protein